MKTSRNSPLKIGKRRPYEPISRVFDLPPALLEMSTLIERGLGGDREALQKAFALQESIIQTALDNPSCLSQIRNLFANGYEFKITLENCGHDTNEGLKTSEHLTPTGS